MIERVLDIAPDVAVAALTRAAQSRRSHLAAARAFAFVPATLVRKLVARIQQIDPGSLY